jgi:hypothetical protein
MFVELLGLEQKPGAMSILFYAGFSPYLLMAKASEY